MGRPGSADDPRVDRRLVQDRLTRLARLTSELVMADNVEAVSKTVVAHVADAVGAKAAFMTLLCDDGKKLRLVGMSGGLPDDTEKWGTFPLAARTPAGEVVRARERLTLTGAGVIARRYPNLDVAARGSHALVVLPLSVGPRSLGAVGLSFAEEHDLDPTELDFLDTRPYPLTETSARRESYSSTNGAVCFGVDPLAPAYHVFGVIGAALLLGTVPETLDAHRSPRPGPARR